jgi:putative oxidoreductase
MDWGTPRRPDPLRGDLRLVGPRLPPRHAADGGRLHARQGAPLPELTVPLTGIAIAAAGVLIVIGLWVDLAALVIAAFLLSTAYFMHAFWKVADPQEKQMEQVHFMKDVALAGAALALFSLFQQFGEAIGITIEPTLFD